MIHILTSHQSELNLNRLNIAEAIVLEKARYLSETIGYRTVGTKEHAAGETWLLKELEVLKKHCEELVNNASISHPRFLECEVVRQEGSGAHRYEVLI